jgi:hypothetical protein
MNDTDRLDYLQRMATRKIVCRDSNTDRGWRLHETRKSDGVSDIRVAIDLYIADLSRSNNYEFM